MALLPLLSGCAVAIHDHEFCGDMGTLGGSCFHSLTTESRDVPEPAWDDERFGMICSTADTYADLKATIEKLCSYAHCDYDTQQKIDLFFQNVATFKSKTTETKN